MKNSIIHSCRKSDRACARAARLAHVQRGFTLIELMVGLVLGMIASLAIFSTISAFEAQRRTTGSGADMQQNGLLALYSVEQDIRMAGYGLIDTTTTPGNMPCAKINAYNPASVFNAAPVTLTNGSTGTDIITINRFNSDTGGIVTGGGAAYLATPLSSGSAPSSLALNSNVAINANDFILLAQPGLDCSLMKVTSVATGAGGTPASGIGVTSVGNSGGDTSQTGIFPAYGSAASAVVVNLGPAATVSATTIGPANPAFTTTKYQINSNYDLIRSEDGGSTWSTVASNIVTIAAQYGVSNAGSQPVTCWTDAAGNGCSGTNWASPSAADIKRIKAIRVAVVARSAQPTTCNNTAPVWFGGTIDISGIPNSACYRYKIYQTIIPIRNVIWGNL